MRFTDVDIRISRGSAADVAVAIDQTDAEESRVTLSGLGEATTVERVDIRTDLRLRQLVEHGWQSWSTVRSTSVSDQRPERSAAPRWFRHEMLADGDSAGRVLSADTVLVHEEGLLGTLSLSSHPVTFTVDSDGAVTASILLDGRQVEAGSSVEIGRLFAASGNPSELLVRWAGRSGELAKRRAPRPQPFGWCSWYQYFTKVKSSDIVHNMELAAAHGLELIQIDDGWQPSVGEWSGTASGFGRPIGELTQLIRSSGMQAGIWTAPFLAIEGRGLALRRPDWLLRNESGTPRTVMFHPDWGGRVFALDTSRPDVIEHLRVTFAELRALGFDYFKIDFLYAAAMPGARFDGGILSRTDALRVGLEAIRSGIGDDAYLLGCGCPLAPAVGIVDAMRVSEDVAPHWGPAAHFPGWPESTVGTVNAIEQSIRRAPLHRRWFATDPDCALLRPVGSQLSVQQRNALAVTITGTGGFTVLSDDLSTYGRSEWDRVAEMAARRLLVDEPLVLDDPLATDVLTIIGPRHELSVDLRRGLGVLDVEAAHAR